MKFETCKNTGFLLLTGGLVYNKWVMMTFTFYNRLVYNIDAYACMLAHYHL